MGAASPRAGRRSKSGNKKVIALFVLLGLGACFWVPMLLKSDGPKRARGASTSSAEKAHLSAPEKGEARKPSGVVDLPTDWKKLRDLLIAGGVMEGGDRPSPMAAKVPMPLAMQQPPGRDPFMAKLRTGGHRRAATSAAYEGDTAGNKFDLAAESPEAVGMRLCSTVVGENYRGAIISGDVYEVGDLAPRVPASHIPEGVELFEVTDIQMRKVLLRRRGRTHVLPIKPSPSPGRAAADGPPRGRRSRRGGDKGG